MAIKITPPKLARRWGIAPEKVLAWIKSGELPAMDASTIRGGRPRYLIDEDDIAAFVARRTVHRKKLKRRSGRRKTDGTRVIKFFD